MKKGLAFILLALSLFCVSNNALAQSKLTQNIQGIVVDRSSGAPLSYVTIILPDAPQFGTTTNNNGEFILKDCTGRTS